MPVKNKVNYRAAAHSDTLSDLATQTHKKVIKGAFVSAQDLDALIDLANNLKRELRPASAVDTSDPFLTEGPKVSEVSKLPTEKVPVVEPVREEQVTKKGFLGR